MKLPQAVVKTPWDEKIFALPTFEILDLSAESLAFAESNPGHYTLRQAAPAPLESLVPHGFYYCDTLLQPATTAERFLPQAHPGVAIDPQVSLEAVLAICHGAFRHGRFHRDFNIDNALADLRYDQWLTQLHGQGEVFGLLFEGVLAGFFGVAANRIVLHAIAEPFQGRGIAKFLWSAACARLFLAGHPEISSSVSAANVAVVNLYASLGFRFRNPQEIFHKMTLAPPSR